MVHATLCGKGELMSNYVFQPAPQRRFAPPGRG